MLSEAGEIDFQVSHRFKVLAFTLSLSTMALRERKKRFPKEKDSLCPDSKLNRTRTKKEIENKENRSNAQTNRQTERLKGERESFREIKNSL